MTKLIECNIKYKLVYIKWRDSVGCTSQWGDIPDKTPPEHFCYSVGWLVRESQYNVVIIPHMSPENKEIHAGEQGCGEMTIPRTSIVYVNELKERRLYGCI
jgi:hypothetical protein